MAPERRYWMISPNVKKREQEVDRWKEAILKGCAIMGDRNGKEPWDYRFAKEVQTGDVMIIGRRKHKQPDMVAFGIVHGKCLNKYFRQPDNSAYCWDLKPFKSWGEGERGTLDAGLLNLLPINRTLTRLHPERNHAHATLCEWIERELGLDDRKHSNDRRSERTPRQPDISRRHEVEKKALEAVEAMYRLNGFPSVEDVSGRNLGWDLEAKRRGKHLKIEVKGLSGDTQTIQMTPNEYLCIKSPSTSYRLCIVTMALDENRQQVHEYSYSSKLRRWSDREGNCLRVEPREGAVLSA